MQILDNVNNSVRDDLAVTLAKGDKLSIAAACFSIYTYQALKKQLDGIAELRFIFTSPTFLLEKTPKERREFYIPRLNRERSLYGTEFEVKLRNELTQRAIARECADWIKKKASFKSNMQNGHIDKFIDIKKTDGGYSYTLPNGFTTADIGCEHGNNILASSVKCSHGESRHFLDSFDMLWNDKKLLADVTEQVVAGISAAYDENAPEFIYHVALYNIFREFLADLDEDELPKEATGFKNTAIYNKLYDFQKEACEQIISKLNKYNGCILADSVGLGKTFTAIAVIKYFEIRNQRVLVLCPKKLGENWLTYRGNYKNNPLLDDKLRYDVLFHTDLSREYGKSGDTDLAALDWGNYDLVVIDESHNFRNGGDYTLRDGIQHENRYLRLMNKVIRDGVKTKVLMLSATPVNNGFSDLRHQLELAYEGRAAWINERLDTKKSIDIIFRNAQTAFNRFSKLPPAERSTANLLRLLDFDFFTLLDSVTIARSRKHIEKYYNIDEIGRFPERLPPETLQPKLTDLPSAINYEQIYGELMRLSLAVYIPSDFLHESKRSKYIDPHSRINRAGREVGMRRLMSINLLKRLESSVESFKITLARVKGLIDATIADIDAHERGSKASISAWEIDAADFDQDDQNTDCFEHRGKKLDIDLADMDYITWRERLRADADILELLMLMIQDISPEHDVKLQTLLELIQEKIAHPFNEDNKKILIFSAFSDTVEYLYREITPLVQARFGLDVAMVTGSLNRTSVKMKNSDLNAVLTLFSPISKDKHLLVPDNPAEIDILIATDCISEGQNLQDCDCCINYDIHWNPVRIIQRFGRIDRIGSKNAKIKLVNFWADVDLDVYLNLKGRVETRMKAGILVATGDDNIIAPEEQGDLEYRRAPLERLREEIMDIEEMQTGISIMDLGLNEFRLDLLEYVKQNGDMDKVPFGLHAVVSAGADCPPGVVFVLKNRNIGVPAKSKILRGGSSVNIDMQNRLHPFYMVYIANDGAVVHDHLAPKELLDKTRALCRGGSEPLWELCRIFNAETKDGRDMRGLSALLSAAISSIIAVKAEGDVDSLFSAGGTHALHNSISGLDDFELICFLVVR